MEHRIITVNTADIEAADWLANRAALVERAAAITQVTNDEELEIAGKFETDAKKAVKKLESIRKAITTPLDDVKKEIMAQEKALRKPLEDEQTRVNRMTTGYATMLAKKAEEERLAREAAERAAAEAQLAREAEAEEAARKAAEANAAFGITDDTVPPPAPLPPPPVVPLPVVTTTGPHTSSNRFVEKWDFEITDANAVPRELCSPDEKKIRAVLAAKKTEGYKADQITIAGIRISASMQVYAR